MNKIFFLILSLSLFLSLNVIAAIDAYPFKDAEKQQRFQQLTTQLRCPKCQNQNLADSNAEIAKDLRTKIYLMLEANQTDAQIIDYLLERYGEFVLYQPRLSKQTLLLWIAPAFIFLLGIIAIGIIVYLRRKNVLKIETSALTAEQQQKLAAIFTQQPGTES